MCGPPRNGSTRGHICGTYILIEYICRTLLTWYLVPRVFCGLKARQEKPTVRCAVGIESVRGRIRRGCELADFKSLTKLLDY